MEELDKLDAEVNLRVSDELRHRAQKKANREKRSRSHILRRWIELGEHTEAVSEYKELRLKE